MPGAFPGISQASSAYQQRKKPAPGVQAVRDFRARPAAADPMETRRQWAQFVGSGASTPSAGVGLSAAMTGGRPEGTMARLGGREVQWTKGDDGNWGWLPFQTEGQMARQALASSQPPVVERSVVAPGLGAPSAVITPQSRARTEALNTASQQAGGPNLSQPLVPTEAQAAAQQFAASRQENPLAAVPELIDQRSAAYSQRADIQAWAKANPELAARLAAKQRRDLPSPMQADAAGARAAFGSDLDVGPGARALDEVAFKGGVEPAAGDELRAAYQAQLRGVPAGSMEGLAYQGPAPVSQPAAMQQQEAGLQMAFGGGLDVAPQATAQQSNLNGPESPLKDAVLSQSAADQKKNFQMQLGSDLLSKYRLKAAELGSSWRG